MIDLDKLFNRYKLSLNEQEEITKYIYDIYIHPKFQERLSDSFLRHDKISLGEHILEDTIVTYLLIKGKKVEVDIDIALKIAMFHDLYTLPWQNNSLNDATKFTNKHGFRHPIEAIINAINWFPEHFNDLDKAYMIIDGVVHHMYPLPVGNLYTRDENNLELQNYDLLQNINDALFDLIVKSCNRGYLNSVSFASSQFMEGKLMSKADKKVSLNNFKNTSIKSKLALLTGINKSLEK